MEADKWDDTKKGKKVPGDFFLLWKAPGQGSSLLSIPRPGFFDFFADFILTKFKQIVKTFFTKNLPTALKTLGYTGK